MSNATKGFASMDTAKRRAVASKGGKSGKGHRWSSEEARKAGKIGGKVSTKRRKEIHG